MTTVERGSWWALGSLTVAVLATTLAVPSLVPTPDRALSATPASLPAAPPSAAAAPVPTAPVPAAPASADEALGRSPSASPSPSVTSAAPAPSSPPPPAAVFQTIRIPATDPGNERFRVEATDCPTCASGSRIQYLGVGQTLTVHVRGVLVGGRRQMTIYYTCGGGARPLDVIVNNGDKTSLSLAGNDSWIDPATVTIPIDLPVGDTEIRFFHATEPSVDLDQIVIA